MAGGSLPAGTLASAGGAGARLALPLLVLSLGGEMIYILDQRLRAQKVPDEKAAKVLGDVVSTMLQKEFIEELFKPQETYTSWAMRLVFDKLAHSSIMRLSTSSMDKLYVLMTMGLKYCVVCCTRPEMLAEVTGRHLETMATLLAAKGCERHSEGRRLLRDVLRVAKLVKDVYGNMSAGDLSALRMAIFRFLQDRRVKVTLFLGAGLQAATGHIAVPPPMADEAAGELPVGTVITYNTNGTEKGRSKIDPTSMVELSSGARPHAVAVGGNLYADDVNSARPAPAGTGKTAAEGEASAAVDEAPGPPPKLAVAPEELFGGQSSKRAAGQLNALASLLGKGSEGKAAVGEFKLNLFGEDSGGGTGSGAGAARAAAAAAGLRAAAAQGAAAAPSGGADTIVIDACASGGGGARSQAESLQNLMKNLDMDDAGAASAGGAGGEVGDGDDLLDLLDEAGS